MKKVLIITYYWPPAGGSGVQRWLKFTKYLPKNNWMPIIYTPEDPYFEVKDTDLLDDVPSEVRVLKKSIWEPYTLKSRLFGKSDKSQSVGVISRKRSFKNYMINWIRGNFFIPDPKVYWVNPSVKFLKDKIRLENIKHIVTTGPPHSMHLIGLSLKQAIPNLKWIADFRDPWSELDILDEFHLLPFVRNRHRMLEKKVLQNADIALTVSERWAEDLRRLGAKNVQIIYNGYDSDDFKLEPKENDKFIIGHYGLLNHLRNPKFLWKTLDDMCNQDKNFNNRLEIHLSGNIDQQVINEIRSYPTLQGKLKLLGYLSHAEVVKQYNQVDILLLLLFNSESGVGNYPGKIFEYFAASKPIIAFGPEDSDTQNLMNKLNTGVYFTYKDQNIREEILNLYCYQAGVEIKDVDRFSREKLTADLSVLLNKL
tara:strand:+ start:5536 stop:6807 length:1272 start_codon:yes stop_codon:yes gene_type:complete